MIRRRLAAAFVAMLALMLTLLLPLRLALSAADLPALGLSARNVSGPAWAGRLHAARLRERSVGDIVVALRPWPLLLGVRQVEVATPMLSLDILSGRQVGIANASGRITLDRIDSLPGLDLQLQLADVDLRFSQGQCVKAGGVVHAEVRAPGTRPVELNGELRCDGNTGVLALTAPPRPGASRIDATLTVAAYGGWQLSSRVDPVDDATGVALQLAGFQQTPSGLQRLDNGQLLR